MRRIFLGISIAALASALGCSAGRAKTVEHPAAYDEFIAHQAKKHGVPERLVHRILMRESRYDPRVFHNNCYGLMQIKYPTARSMGYNGGPQGLFDPYVNMTYAIPYLANAYHIAGGDEDRAVQLFAGGYYSAAKQKHMIAALRTADSPAFKAEPPQAVAYEPPRSAMPALFAFLENPSQSPVQNLAASAAEPAQASAMAVPSAALAYAGQVAPAQAAEVPVDAVDIAQPGQKPADVKAARTHAAKAAPNRSARIPKTKINVASAEQAAPPAPGVGTAAAVIAEPGQKPAKAKATANHPAKAAPIRTAQAPKTKINVASAEQAAPPAPGVGTVAAAIAEPEQKPAKANAAANHPAEAAPVKSAHVQKKIRVAMAERTAPGPAKDAKAHTASGATKGDAVADAGTRAAAERPAVQKAPGDAN